MKILTGWAIFGTFLGLYLLAIRFILGWLAQFSGYPILLNLTLVSLVVVILAGGLFCWTDDLDERRGVADIAVVFARPFVFYLGAVGCCLYAIAFVVGAILLLPFSLFWPQKRAGLN
ncbi:hypothetical protein [Laspinema palackyanum]|uniref:hypothetical protein n=1 Tax=Laspinema palackyanum TaxID=3231601 RepID=UPI00345CA745|nr:hypothetical protein [Laspinema sp. D2c]